VNWRVIIRPRAEADLREAKAWYDNKRPGLGDAFVSEVRQAVRLLEQSPERHPIYYRSFRRLLTRRFPYRIFYQIERESVVVFRILHVRRLHGPQLQEG
jgi:toxin ParE1/3/4